MESINTPLSVSVEPRAKKAKIGFGLGIISIVTWIIPIIGLPVSICGIVFSSIGLNSSEKKKAVAGLILSILFTVVGLFNSFLGASIAVLKEYDRQIRQLDATSVVQPETR